MQTKIKFLKITLIIATIVFVLTGYLFLTGKIGQKNEAKEKSANSTVSSVGTKDWKTFSFNGDALRFKYPAIWCWDNKDCRNLYAVHYEDVVFIGQNQLLDNTSDGYIYPILPIYYVGNIDQDDAEKYLKNKYEQPESISWTIDKNNPEVKVASVVGPNRIYASYSKEIRTLVFFNLPLACLFDCQTDKDVINSIEVNGVKVYQK